MTRIVRNDRGATLTEQLVALLLGSVMITGLYGFYRSELFHHISQETKIATLEDQSWKMLGGRWRSWSGI